MSTTARTELLTFYDYLQDSGLSGHNVQAEGLYTILNKNVCWYKFFDEVPKIEDNFDSISFMNSKFSFNKEDSELIKWMSENSGEGAKPYFRGFYFIIISELPMKMLIHSLALNIPDFNWPHGIHFTAFGQQNEKDGIFILPVLIYTGCFSTNPILENKVFEASPTISDLKIVDEPYGKGVSFKSNDKEYRVVSGDYDASTLYSKLKKLVDKNLGGRLWQFINNHAIVYWIEGKGTISYNGGTN